MKRLVAVLTAAFLILIGVARPADAATRVVWVNWYGSSTWPVSNSVNWVDYYTGSDMRFGYCHAGYKCITIRERTINSSWSAVTYGFGTSRVTIYLNPQRRWYGYYTKRRIIDHELGHANGIYSESYACSNRMYWRVYCSNGKLPPRAFTYGQRLILTRN